MMLWFHLKKKSFNNQERTTKINHQSKTTPNQSRLKIKIIVVNQNQVQPQKMGNCKKKKEKSLKTEIKSDEQLLKSLDKVALNATTKKSTLKVDAKTCSIKLMENWILLLEKKLLIPLIKITKNQ